MPQIGFHASLDQAIAASIIELKLLLDFDGEALASVLDPACTAVSILLSPEGGLSAAEIQLARAAGFTSTRLGPRVLRTETAATAALAIAQSAVGDLA